MLGLKLNQVSKRGRRWCRNGFNQIVGGICCAQCGTELKQPSICRDISPNSVHRQGSQTFPKWNSRTFQWPIKDKITFFKHCRIVIWCIVNAFFCDKTTYHIPNYNIHHGKTWITGSVVTGHLTTKLPNPLNCPRRKRFQYRQMSPACVTCGASSEPVGKKRRGDQYCVGFVT